MRRKNCMQNQNKLIELTEQTNQQQVSIPEEDLPIILDFITESNEHLEAAEVGLLELENKPNDQEVLKQIFRAFHTIKGMSGFLKLEQIGSLAHSSENLLDLARKGELILTGENTNITLEAIDMLKKMLSELKIAAKKNKPVPAEKHLSSLLEKLKASTDTQSLASSLGTPQGLKNDKQLDEVLISGYEPQINESFSSANSIININPANEKIKVSTERLDNLVNMAGELVIAQLMVAEEANTNLVSEYELNHKVTYQGKIVRDLQELSMSMRMVPVDTVFQKMGRLVRDLSLKAEKTINLVTSGEQTELDRNIVDKIADPLVHMIRNSIDHGIESPEERTKAGKNPVGKIELRAFHQAGNIIIEIEDDGKGLDKDHILKKAIDNGLVEAGQQLDDQEIFKLIFHAGLSTAKNITNLSGRGVGMDVVKKNIESLRGKIEIFSTEGKGTTFKIRMPLTLAIIDAQIIKIGSERYVIPINSIVKTFRPDAEQLSTIQNRGEMAIIHGEILPLLRLYRLFGVESATKDPTKALLVIVETDSKKCCLLVDQLLSQQQVVIKTLGDGLRNIKGVSGGAIMGDGKVSLILDIPRLMEMAQK